MSRHFIKNNIRMSSSFHGKVVVITGSSKGIGKATALEFLKAGASVVMNGRDPKKLHKTVNEFKGMGFDPLEVPGDMSSYHDCEELVRKTLQHFGCIDILVNNAGGGFRGKIEKTAPDVFKKVLNSNLMTAIYSTRAALESLKRSKGSVIFVSSLAGIRGLPENGPYCVAKMGLTALAQTLKLELHGTGVHVGIIMVGLTDYDQDKQVISADGSLMAIRRKSDQTREQVAKKILLLARNRKFLMVLTTLGKLNMLFQKISPSLVEWTIRQSSRTEKYNN